MEQTSLARALIINLDRGERIECMFNPNEYSVHKQNSWLPGGAGGRDLPQLEFAGGQAATLQMQLFFDTYAAGQDVRTNHTDAIWRLMLVDPDLRDAKSQQSRPPLVRFQWGTSWSFDAVLLRVDQRFTLFLANGTPVRATLDVTFQQIKDNAQLPAQNPTSGGEGGERLWTVTAGDTLAWIAHKSYGDAGQWRRIASANRLLELRDLEVGLVLVIPGS